MTVSLMAGRVKGFACVEPDAGVDRLVLVIAADCATWLGSAKCALRLMRLAARGSGSQTDARRTVTEKVAALAEAQAVAAAAVIKGGKSHRVAKKVLGVYKKRVRPNRRRPTRK